MRRLTALRRDYPTLRRGRFLTGRHDEALGGKDVTWIAPTGREMDQDAWHDEALRCFGMLMDGRAQPTGIRRRGTDATLLLLLNAQADEARFVLPPCSGGLHWKPLFDTARPEADLPALEIGEACVMTGCSLVLLRLNA